MNASGILGSVRFVVGRDGRPTAVQLDMETWNALLDWLEDHEDRAVVRANLARLRAGPREAGALRWEEACAMWERDEADPSS